MQAAEVGVSPKKNDTSPVCLTEGLGTPGHLCMPELPLLGGGRGGAFLRSGESWSAFPKTSSREDQTQEKRDSWSNPKPRLCFRKELLPSIENVGALQEAASCRREQCQPAYLPLVLLRVQDQRYISVFLKCLVFLLAGKQCRLLSASIHLLLNLSMCYQ